MVDKGIRAAERFMHEHDPEPEHALQVHRLSMDLFDALRGIHGLGDIEKRLLAAAALMHDTGFSVDVQRHHKHARDLILEANIEGFSASERRVVACIARYHRKAHPKPIHKAYRDLKNEDRDVVNRLAALLRIADGLDRSHAANTENVRTERRGNVIRLHVKQRRPNSVDLWGAERKKQLFEEVFGLGLEIVPSSR